MTNKKAQPSGQKPQKVVVIGKDFSIKNPPKPPKK
jgi:hypothetical protein